MIDRKEIMEWQRKREAWKERLLELARKKDFEGVLRGMAENIEDEGDIELLIVNFCENADPMDGKEWV
ncbi:MAG: hypothetical protein IJ521_06400 [Schwartzia sp.]|nr:hypothetical protein [Schwartzia sp. (in: firmicutes)]